MIICEECNARNRNGAYVCEECGASLLHLEPTADDSEPVKRKAPLFGRKERFVEDETEYEDGEDDVAATMDIEEEEPEEGPVRPRRPLFGRKARFVDDEPEYEDGEDDAAATMDIEEEEPEEEPVRQRRPLFGRKARFVDNEPEYEDGEDDAAATMDIEEEEPVHQRRPLFGRKARFVEDEPEYEDSEDDAAATMDIEEEEPEEEPVRQRRPLFGRKARFVDDEPEHEDADDEAMERAGMPEAGPVRVRKPLVTAFLEEDEPEEDVTEPQMGQTIEFVEEHAEEVAEPQEEIVPHADTGLSAAEAQMDAEPVHSIELDVPSAEQPARTAVKVSVRDIKSVRVRNAAPAAPPSSIDLDMEVQHLDDDDEVAYEDDDGYDRARPVRKPDFRAAYQKSVRSDSDRMTGGMIAAIITVSSLLVVTLVVLGVLMVGKMNRSEPVIAAPTTIIVPAPTEEAGNSPVLEASPGAAAAPTTQPEEEFGSVLEQPTDGQLPGVDQ